MNEEEDPGTGLKRGLLAVLQITAMAICVLIIAEHLMIESLKLPPSLCIDQGHPANEP